LSGYEDYEEGFMCHYCDNRVPFWIILGYQGGIRGMYFSPTTKARYGIATDIHQLVIGDDERSIQTYWSRSFDLTCPYCKHKYDGRSRFVALFRHRISHGLTAENVTYGREFL